MPVPETAHLQLRGRRYRDGGQHSGHASDSWGDYRAERRDRSGVSLMAIKWDGTITLGHVLTFVGFAAGGVGAFVSISNQIAVTNANQSIQAQQAGAATIRMDGLEGLARSTQLLAIQTQVLVGVLTDQNATQERKIEALQAWQAAVNQPP